MCTCVHAARGISWMFFIQFASEASEDALIEQIDGTIGDWYLAGFNGDFGDAESGRFHYITTQNP